MRESKLIQVSAEETKISVSKSGPNAKTFLTPYFANVRNKIDCLFLASLSASV